MRKAIEKIVAFVENLLEEYEHFTGKLELNFKDGDLKDINVTQRTKFEEGVCDAR